VSATAVVSVPAVVGDAVSLDWVLSSPHAAAVSRSAVRAAMELNRFMGQSSVSPEDRRPPVREDKLGTGG